MEITVDSYEMTHYIECPQKDAYRFRDNLVLKSQNKSAAFGIVLHAGREAWKKAVKAGHPDPLGQGLLALDASYKKEMAGIVLEEGDPKSWENALALFKNYTQKFPARAYKPMAVEVPFKVYVGRSPDGYDVYRSGILDEVPVYDDRLYVLDLKTTSRYPSASFFKKFKLSGQVLGYIWCARKVIDPDIHGLIIHAIWVNTPTVPKLTKKGEPYKNGSKYRWPDDYFQAEIITPSDDHLEEWRKSFLGWVDERERARKSGFYKMAHGAACANSIYTCDYYNLCHATPNARKFIRQMDYEVKIWNPLGEQRITTPEGQS